MRIFVITSDYQEVPLAEVRTDGKNLDWTVDNTQGKLPEMAQGSLARLKRIVGKSSHLAMTPPTKPTVGLHRYQLTNGDVVEMSTDGKTAILNGEMLGGTEKQALMGLLGSGKLKVKQKADLSRPVPVLPQRRKPLERKQEAPIPKGAIDAFEMDRKADEKREKLNTVNRDMDIENIDLSDEAYPSQTRDFLYLMKYGKAKGGRNV